MCGMKWNLHCRSAQLTDIKSLLHRNPFHGSSGLYSKFSRGKSATDHPERCTLRFSVFLWPLSTHGQMLKPTAPKQKTYSGSDQLRPARQRWEPVASWLNPRSTLLLCARGGISSWSWGVIQSITALLSPLVSSNQELLQPFCNFYSSWQELEDWWWTYQIHNVPDVLLWCHFTHQLCF